MILAATIALEIGDDRAISERRASGQLCGHGAARACQRRSSAVRARRALDVNRYLKWAFAEAANSVAVNYKRRPERHVSRALCAAAPAQKGHNKAVGAVARHLAEARLSCPEPSAGVSRSGRGRGSDQGGVNATWS